MIRTGSRLRTALVYVLMTAALAVSVVLTIRIGSSQIPVRDVYGILIDQLGALLHGQAVGPGRWPNAQFQIVWNIRLPRVLFGMLCGMGLSLSGAAMQALVLNPIADPYILGISSGASAGAAWALLMPLPWFTGQFQVSLTAMLGAMFASACVYTIARLGGGGQIRPVALLLAGTSINAVMSAITSFLIFLAKSPESIAAVYNWQMGSIAVAQWSSLKLPFVGTALGFAVFTAAGRPFNMLMMGDEDALAMGVPVKGFRTIMFAICSLIVACMVSITGIIGFVGLIVPHVARMLSGTSDNRVIFPQSALLGGTFLIWCDAGARGLFGGAELPLGMITAFLGAPFFLYLLVQKKYGGGRA